MEKFSGKKHTKWRPDLDTHNVARKFPLLLFVGVTCIGNCEHLTVSSGFIKRDDLFNIFSALFHVISLLPPLKMGNKLTSNKFLNI
jgi:hypothetical protein